MNSTSKTQAAGHLLKKRIVVVAILATLLTAGTMALAAELPTPANSEQAAVQDDVVVQAEPAAPAVQEQAAAQAEPAPVPQVLPASDYFAREAADAAVDGAPGRATGQQVSDIYAGLVPVRNDTGRYTVGRPASWSVLDLSDDRAHSIWLMPDATDRSTRFAIEVRDAGRAITSDDLPALIASFDNLIRALPETNVIWQNRYYSEGGAALVFEARLTHRAGDTDVTRWVRLVYQDTREYYIVAESDMYPVWSDAFMVMMLTLSLG